MKKHLEKRGPIWMMLAFLLVGIICLFLHAMNDNRPQSPNVSIVETHGQREIPMDTKTKFVSSDTFFELIRDLGIALILAGIVGITLETNLWRKYFNERLREIYVEKAFLKKLGKEELLELQTNTLKAYFNNDAIDYDQSFYNFFRKEVQSFISNPYRENVKIKTVYSEVPGSVKFKCIDNIRFECRSVQGTIQSEIKWCPDSGDSVISVEECFIKITLPNYMTEKERKRIPFYDKFKNGTLEFYVNVAHPNSQQSTIPQIIILDEEPKTGRQGFKLSLDTFSNIDKLSVYVEVHYLTDQGGLVSLQQPCLTHNYNLEVEYPETYQLNRALFGTLPNQGLIEDFGSGRYTLEYKSWLMAEQGVAYNFQRKNITK
jgi:hypothetical protein